MNNIRTSDDLYKTYPYAYRYYRRQVPYDCCKAPMVAPMVRRQLGPQAAYNNNVPVEGDGALSNCDCPTSPYYVVPVMYVPKRVLPNDRSFRPVASTSCVRRYYKGYENAEDYNYYQQYHQNVDGVTGGEGDVEDNLSCYNMDYASSDKEEPADIYDYEEPSYVVKPKVLVKPTQPPYSPPDLAKIRTKPDNYNHKVTDYNAYLQSQEPQMPYYQRQLDFEEYKLNHLNDPTRIPNAPNFPKDENEVEKPLSLKTFEKSRVTILSQLKSNLDQGTQTLQFKTPTGTISTQTEQELILNSYLNLDPEGLPPKDSRRNLTKKKFTSTLPVLESRLESPVRRLRKF